MALSESLRRSKPYYLLGGLDGPARGVPEVLPRLTRALRDAGAIPLNAEWPRFYPEEFRHSRALVLVDVGRGLPIHAGLAIGAAMLTMQRDPAFSVIQVQTRDHVEHTAKPGLWPIGTLAVGIQRVVGLQLPTVEDAIAPLLGMLAEDRQSIVLPPMIQSVSP